MYIYTYICGDNRRFFTQVNRVAPGALDTIGLFSVRCKLCDVSAQRNDHRTAVRC